MHTGPEKFLVFDLDVYPMNIGENDLSIRITNISVSLTSLPSNNKPLANWRSACMGVFTFHYLIIYL